MSVSVDGQAVGLNGRTAILDTGTTLILIADDAFLLYQVATGGVEDVKTGLLRITSAQFKALKNLNFVIGGVST